MSTDSLPKISQQKTGTVTGIEPGDYHIPNLAEELTSLLPQISHGRVTTYGDLADALGSRRAARWVGEYLLNHDHSDGCPCHRVVRHQGELGRYVTGDGGPGSEWLNSNETMCRKVALPKRFLHCSGNKTD